MTHILNKVVLLLATLSASVLITGCKDEEQTHNTYSLSGYMVSTYSLFHTYYKPKNANILPIKKLFGETGMATKMPHIGK